MIRPTSIMHQPDGWHKVAGVQGSSRLLRGVQVGNALEELQGKELKAATDAACSPGCFPGPHERSDRRRGVVQALCQVSADWVSYVHTSATGVKACILHSHSTTVRVDPCSKYMGLDGTQ